MNNFSGSDFGFGSKDSRSKENTTGKSVLIHLLAKCYLFDLGRWTNEEHQLFLEGLKIHKKQWKLIAELIKTRTVVQIRTHAQKYFQKLLKSAKSEDFENGAIPDFIAAAAKASRQEEKMGEIDLEDGIDPTIKQDSKKTKSRARSNSNIDVGSPKQKRIKVSDKKPKLHCSSPSPTSIGDFFPDGANSNNFFPGFEDDDDTWHNGLDFGDFCQGSSMTNLLSEQQQKTHEQRDRENSIATTVDSQDSDDFCFYPSQTHGYGGYIDPSMLTNMAFNNYNTIHNYNQTIIDKGHFSQHESRKMTHTTTSDIETDGSGDENSSYSNGDLFGYTSNEWDEDDSLVNGLLEAFA